MNLIRVTDLGSVDTKNEKSKVYFDYLDSLRFFAFLAVFIAHAGILFPVSANWFYWLYRNVISHGAYGVNFFFVLSGFLITFLLLKEKDGSRYVDIPLFYIKRVLRIWPVYYLVFLISILILPVWVNLFGAGYIPGENFASTYTFVNMGMHTSMVAIFSYLFFVGNIVQGYDLGVLPFALGVLWSVCVEEQFYLVWPWIVKKLKKKNIAYVALALFFTSLIYKALHINDANIAYYLTLSVAMDLASGALLAIYYSLLSPGEKIGLLNVRNVLLRSLNVSKNVKHLNSNRFQIVLLIVLNITIYAFCFLYLFSNGTGFLYDSARLMKRPVLDAFFVLILIYFLNKENRGIDSSSGKSVGLANRPFTYLGRISYGLYAYHAICVIGVVAVFNYLGVGPNTVSVMNFLSIFVISLFLTIYLSHISYQFLEKRALRQKEKFASLRAINRTGF